MKKLFEDRQEDVVYEETASKVTAILKGKESAAATKYVRSMQDYQIADAACKQLKEQASILASKAREAKTIAEEQVRELATQYFDSVMDAAKTKVIKTCSVLIKISKQPIAHESRETDWEAVVNELADVLQIPIEILNKAIEKHTEVELVIPKMRLYPPEEISTVNESFGGGFIKVLMNKIRFFYEKLLKKFKICDKLLSDIEAKYL